MLTLNPFTLSGFSTLTLWTGPFPIERCLVNFYYKHIFVAIPVFNANSVDPDQMLCSAVSDLGLHCLPMSPLWDTRLNPSPAEPGYTPDFANSVDPDQLAYVNLYQQSGSSNLTD